MSRTIVRRDYIWPKDSRLGRHVHHDSESRRYAFDAAGITVTSVRHTRNIPILDQGQVGSCTGNAGIGALGTDPLWPTVESEMLYPFNEQGAVKVYSAAETIDGDGPYPPNDNGSCGLSVAKVFKNGGIIPGYQHAFDWDTALAATVQYPTLWGLTVYDGIFSPDADGRYRLTGGIAGGHEIVCDEIDAERERLWFANSWGTIYGVNGRFYMTFNDAKKSLADQGDVTILLPATVPAPTPTPNPEADPNDLALARSTKQWALGKHTWPATKEVANDLKTWYTAKGL